MKIVQYTLIFVFFGIVSTSIAGSPIPDAYGSDDIARRNGVNVDPQTLIPRIYIPYIPHGPEGQKYLEYYSPDNYCSLYSVEKISIRSIKQCFESKEKWIRLNQ